MIGRLTGRLIGGRADHGVKVYPNCLLLDSLLLARSFSSSGALFSLFGGTDTVRESIPRRLEDFFMISVLARASRYHCDCVSPSSATVAHSSSPPSPSSTPTSASAIDITKTSRHVLSSLISSIPIADAWTECHDSSRIGRGPTLRRTLRQVKNQRSRARVREKKRACRPSGSSSQRPKIAARW